MAARQKIMVVDSDKSIAQMIALYLGKENFETRIVYDGNEALKEFETFSPDLITLALFLTGVDGYQVCTRIRSISRVPIIIISTKNEVFNKVKAIIADKLALDENSITRESSFVNDLKADSMDILDLVSGFEEEFDITIPDDKGRTFETVGEVVDYLATLI